MNRKITIRRDGAIGDVLCASFTVPLVRKLTGLDVVYQANPATHCVLRRTVGIKEFEEPNGQATVDLNGSYEHDPNRKNRHFAQCFLNSVYAQLRLNDQPRVTNFAPRMFLLPGDKEYALDILNAFPKPWIAIVPKSNSHAHRTVPDATWAEAAKQISGTKFWLGTDTAPIGIVDLRIRHLDNIIRILSQVHLLCTVDTGPMHIAAALGTPIVSIKQQSDPWHHLSDQRDFIVIQPDGLQCVGCVLDYCPINKHTPPCQNISPSKISEAANNKLRYFNESGVSAVVCVYRPTAAMLNRCLENVEQQVQEIIVVVDEAGTIPAGARKNGKISYLKMPAFNVGYARKLNYGVRHSNYGLIMALNDDCYLNPDVVATLRKTMDSEPDMGAVTHTLRYEDNTLQFSGMYREPGQTGGFGHLDHRGMKSRFTDPILQETICGASFLVKRKAFYDAAGYDDAFYLYSEDTAFGLQLRRAGYKIKYTPLCEGIHTEHVSSYATPGVDKIMAESHKIYAERWMPYMEANKWKIPGTFDY